MPTYYHKFKPNHKHFVTADHAIGNSSLKGQMVLPLLGDLQLRKKGISVMRRHTSFNRKKTWKDIQQKL